MTVDVLAKLFANTTGEGLRQFQDDYLGPYGQEQRRETIVFMCALSALAVAMTDIDQRDREAFYRALYTHFGSHLDSEMTDDCSHDTSMASSVELYMDSIKPERIGVARELAREVVGNREFVNYPGILLNHYLKKRAPDLKPDARLLVLKGYVLATVTNTKRCIDEVDQQYKLDYSRYYDSRS